MRSRNAVLVGVSVVLIALGVFIAVQFGRAHAPTLQVAPVAGADQYTPAQTGLVLPLTQLEGMWRYEKDGSQFKAVVAGDRIDIKILSNDGTTVNYWLGTFKTAESPGHAVESKKIETDEIYLSQSTVKPFQVGVDSLSFEFKAMGVSRTVVLTRG
jgi:hypothetical protein